MVPPGDEDRRSRCCSGHAPSQLGIITMCTTQPLGSPGARFFLLPFAAQA
ncbi:hypothetical protein [Streptomyces sp. NBC_01431]|nr:hypothetical protein [Streptomyces sp. NBC_01431]